MYTILRKTTMGILLAAILLLSLDSRRTSPIVLSDAVNIAGEDWTARRRVILMIGDGMGAEHRKAGRWSKVGLTGKLAMDSLAISGMVDTSNVYDALTDSAAAATAMATGYKTKNGYLGVDQYGTSLTSILDVARERDLMTGLVVTSEIYNATPAAFASHITSRLESDAISSQMLEHDVDILLGGGEAHWLPGTETACNGGAAGLRSDGRNLIAEAQTAGYDYVCTPGDFAAVPSGTSPLIGFFAFGKMSWPYTPTLAAMTETTLDALATDPQGFFLMVEGSQIDAAAHNNDGAWLIDDVKTFDDAIQVALDFATANPDTLLIVTADHETGGLSVYQDDACNAGDDGPFSISGGGSFCTHFGSTGHTDTNVPLTTMGPGSESLAGTYQNTWIYTSMRLYLTAFEYYYYPFMATP